MSLEDSTDSAVVDKGIPLIVHVIYRLECGGLQTVLAECINHMPAQDYRHAVICLTDFTEYAQTITRLGVELHTLQKPPGRAVLTHFKLWKLLRGLRPSVIHTYNVSAIEYNLTALLAGVPVRIHAEHGRNLVELDGNHKTYNFIRRLLVPIIHAYVPVSLDLAKWLRQTIGVPSKKIAIVPNGVDTVRYAPSNSAENATLKQICIGTVGRVDAIKNHKALLDTFRLLLERFPAPKFDLRLAIVGDGPLLQELREQVLQETWAHRVWLPGERRDVADIMRNFSIFVLPSLSEATPVTVLEAMATSLPVVASRVGGVPQLVLDWQTGLLVEPSNLDALANAIATYITSPQLRAQHGAAGRMHVLTNHSILQMVAKYHSLYSHHRLDLS